MGKKKVEMEATSKAYEKYQEYLKKAKKYYIEGAADMLKELDPKKSISKDKWTISL